MRKLKEFTENINPLITDYIPSASELEITDEKFSLEKVKDLYANYFAAKNPTGITSQNEISISDEGTYWDVVYTPSTITYNVDNVPKSVVAGTIQLNIVTGANLRTDAIYIDLLTDTINVEQGEESETPATPVINANWLVISFVTISEGEAVPEMANSEFVVYVGMHGLDTNDGKSIQTAVSTIAQANILATANNYKVIRCIDNGNYYITEFKYGVFYDMPNARITTSDTVILPVFCVIKCYNIYGVITITGGTSYINANKISQLDISGLARLMLSGVPEITYLIISDSPTLYCDSVRVTNTPTLSPTANINGMINGVIYPVIQEGLPELTNNKIWEGDVNNTPQEIDRYIFNNRQVKIGTDFTSAALLLLQSLLTTQVTAVLKAKTGQTADILQFLNSVEGVLAKLDINGHFTSQRIVLGNAYLQYNSNTNSLNVVVS